MPDLLRRLLPVTGVAAAGALAALAALGLTSTMGARLGPGRVEVRATVGGGRTVLELPPLGSIAASTHAAPVALTARVDSLDIEQLQFLLASGNPVDRLESAVERDIEPLARRFAARTLLAAVIVGALAGALLPRRTWTHPVAGALGGLVAVAALLGLAWNGFRPEAFREPRFEGPLEQAPAVLRAARRHVEGLPDVRRRLGVLGDRVADLYSAAAEGAGPPGEGEVRILHVSDVHSNPVGLELVLRLASGFRVDAVLDTGDLTSFGLPIEARLGELIAGVGVPYLFVPGNHDSQDNRASLGDVANVRILDGTVADVGGLRILGVADPTFTASNQTSTTEANAAKLARGRGVAELASRERPDVLAVHDVNLASKIDAETPLVVAGHIHRRTVRQRGALLLVTVGSSGATGLDSFLVRTDLPYEAEILNFAEGRLVSIDYVTLTGIGGNFRVERRLVPTPAPASPTPAPASPTPSTPSPSPPSRTPSR